MTNWGMARLPTFFMSSSAAPGRCAQTTLAKAQIILEQQDATPLYWLYVRPSFARYLADWLLDAMAEYSARES